MKAMTTLPFIDAAQVRRSLPYPALIEALRDTFREPVMAPQRHVHALPGFASLLLMPAWQPDQHIGVKLVTVMPDNRKHSLPTVHALYVLMDAATGAPLALMDGESLTLRRTAAVSALASHYLSRKDSCTLLLVGSGRLAPEMVVAHCAAREIERVLVWGRDAARVAAAMHRMREAGVPAQVALEAAGSLEKACAQSDIICCATTSTEPLVIASAVRPGTHVDLVGGFRPNMREADDTLIATASLFVDTREGALAEAGDLIQPMAAGLIGAASIHAELSALVRGEHAGRSEPSDITLFKSVGTAVADLGAASLVWRATVQG